MKSITKKATKKNKPETLQALNVSIEKPFNAKEVFEFLKDEILNGHTDVYKAFLLFHQMGVILKMFKDDKDLKNALEQAILKMGDSPFYGFVAKWISKKNYDFSVCDDAVWNTINDEIEALKSDKKRREDHLLRSQDEDIKRPICTYTNYAELTKAA